MDIQLIPLSKKDENQFILDNQEAFRYGAMEEFGLQEYHEEEIISRNTIETSIHEGEAFRIVTDGKISGGVIVKIEGKHGHLEILFVDPKAHSKGIGFGAWCAIEKMYPNVEVWETCTPYFEKRNIHFYVNRCGFHIVEFFHSKHKDPNADDMDEMFRFEKVMIGEKNGK